MIDNGLNGYDRDVRKAVKKLIDAREFSDTVYARKSFSATEWLDAYDALGNLYEAPELAAAGLVRDGCPVHGSPLSLFLMRNADSIRRLRYEFVHRKENAR